MLDILGRFGMEGFEKLLHSNEPLGKSTQKLPPLAKQSIVI